jgi:hypothetical protein
MDRKLISGYLAYFMTVTALNMGYPTPAIERELSGLIGATLRPCGSTVSGKKNKKGEGNARSKIE